MRRFFVKDEMFGIPVEVYFCSWESFAKAVAKRYDVTLKQEGANGGKVEQLENSDGSMLMLLWMPHMEADPYHIGILTHESLHVALTVLREVDVRISMTNHEILCYLTEFYVRKCLERILKTN